MTKTIQAATLAALLGIAIGYVGTATFSASAAPSHHTCAVVTQNYGETFCIKADGRMEVLK